jgi:hypothetical protein
MAIYTQSAIDSLSQIQIPKNILLEWLEWVNLFIIKK